MATNLFAKIIPSLQRKFKHIRRVQTIARPSWLKQATHFPEITGTGPEKRTLKALHEQHPGPRFDLPYPSNKGLYQLKDLRELILLL
jgi:hypothetical protein